MTKRGKLSPGLEGRGVEEGREDDDDLCVIEFTADRNKCRTFLFI